jgi:hypothetical protein
MDPGCRRQRDSMNRRATLARSAAFLLAVAGSAFGQVNSSRQTIPFFPLEGPAAELFAKMSLICGGDIGGMKALFAR